MYTAMRRRHTNGPFYRTLFSSVTITATALFIKHYKKHCALYSFIYAFRVKLVAAKEKKKNFKGFTC